MTIQEDCLAVYDDMVVDKIDVKKHNVSVINSIAQLYPDIRQRSKAP
jgi:hypothetical protein